MSRIVWRGERPGIMLCDSESAEPDFSCSQAFPCGCCEVFFSRSKRWSAKEHGPIAPRLASHCCRAQFDPRKRTHGQDYHTRAGSLQQRKHRSLSGNTEFIEIARRCLVRVFKPLAPVLLIAGAAPAQANRHRARGEHPIGTKISQRSSRVTIRQRSRVRRL